MPHAFHTEPVRIIQFKGFGKFNNNLWIFLNLCLQGLQEKQVRFWSIKFHCGGGEGGSSLRFGGGGEGGSSLRFHVFFLA